MLPPIKRPSLLLCLALIPAAWPQVHKSTLELLDEIFNPIQNSANDGTGAEYVVLCRTNAGVSGVCKQQSECQSTDSSQVGNCIGFLDICCPGSAEPVKVTLPIKVTLPDRLTILPPSTRPSEGCGRRRPGGIGEKGNFQNQLQFANFGEFPWMVGVLTNQGSDEGKWNGKSYKGGGTLIGPRAVLTAAHIVREALLKATPLRVRAGESDTDIEEHYHYIESNVETVHVHEQFNHHNFRNDIALLILAVPINSNNYIDYACLPKQGQEAPIVKNCLATGWGKDFYGSRGKLHHRLKRITLPIIPHAECQKRLRETRLGPFFMLHSSFICAGGESDVDSTCQAGGGSPLVCPIPDVRHRYIQYGIVAWGVECSNHNPGGYVDVADYRDWIDSKMKFAGLDTGTYNFP